MIPEKIASIEEIEHIKNLNLSLFVQLKYVILHNPIPYYLFPQLFEQDFSFDHNILHLKRKNLFAIGYWQSEKYFIEYSTTIRQLFEIEQSDNECFLKLKRIICSENSISIHIRRGDYVTNNVTNKVHGVCSIEYYIKAITFISQHIVNPNFFIFSDDIEWVKFNLPIIYPHYYISNYTTLKPFEEIKLMSFCRHHIIANSSFSWWGAWLNTNPDKIVIAPQKWFNNPHINIMDLLPESWIKL